MGVLGDNGQISTVEAITAAIIMISVIVLVVQATSVTPLTSSFTNQHIKLELQNIGMDVLTTLDETPSVNDGNHDTQSMLKKSVTDWINNYYCDWFTWANNADKYKSQTNPLNPSLNIPLGDQLSYLLAYYGIAYNVEIRYSDINNNVKITKMIWNGNPSDNSVTVSRFVVLHDEDILYRDLIPNFGLTTDFYNIVEVKVTLWVM
ncbi:conserved hypothetical protein [Methanocella paludicola SANAE]|uniref:Uncharacterized protein n=2 Tax=Methanocella TaxID=570266 RepID=D1YV61_METPS|nr:conserved hypothetical protein [Methanocella paludicola SANAE]